MAIPGIEVRSGPPLPADYDRVFEISDLSVRFGGALAIEGVTLSVPANEVTAIIGPSGSGKSTLLRCLNRMNDEIPGSEVEGSVLYHGQELYQPSVDTTMLRRQVGMISQVPMPFPTMSIYDNVAAGRRLQGGRRDKDLAERVERALVQAALWDEVKDNLGRSARKLSGGQQQRLCIARALAATPEVLLMDEPCSSLDPGATSKIEEVIEGLGTDHSVIIVTHNMQQAARVSHRTAFLSPKVDETGRSAGRLVEFDTTEKIFTQPSEPDTENYVTGKVG
jgi:phosphate transport system ATP-binding protein